jgi:hypothetical protein
MNSVPDAAMWAVFLTCFTGLVAAVSRDRERLGEAACSAVVGGFAASAACGFLYTALSGAVRVPTVAGGAGIIYLVTILATGGRPGILAAIVVDRPRSRLELTRREQRLLTWAPWTIIGAAVLVGFLAVSMEG